MSESGQGNAGEFIHFRCPAELRTRINELVDKLRNEGTPTTRSQVVRLILAEHLGEDDPVLARVEECVRTLYGAMEEAFGMLLSNANGELRQHLTKALSRKKSGDPGFDDRRRLGAAARRRRAAS